MTEQKSSVAQYYDEGYAVGFSGGSSSSCPYVPGTGPDRRIMATKRMAWAEGHMDGDAHRISILERGQIPGGAPKRQRKLDSMPPVPPETTSPSPVMRRYQRRIKKSGGKPERYVDRRLREIFEEDQRKVSCSEAES